MLISIGVMPWCSLASTVALVVSTSHFMYAVSLTSARSKQVSGPPDARQFSSACKVWSVKTVTMATWACLRVRGVWVDRTKDARLFQRSYFFSSQWFFLLRCSPACFRAPVTRLILNNDKFTSFVAPLNHCLHCFLTQLTWLFSLPPPTPPHPPPFLSGTNQSTPVNSTASPVVYGKNHFPLFPSGDVFSFLLFLFKSDHKYRAWL